MTGPWQLEARGDGRHLTDHIEIDLAYVENISLLTDLVHSGPHRARPLPPPRRGLTGSRHSRALPSAAMDALIQEWLDAPDSRVVHVEEVEASGALFAGLEPPLPAELTGRLDRAGHRPALPPSSPRHRVDPGRHRHGHRGRDRLGQVALLPGPDHRVPLDRRWRRPLCSSTRPRRWPRISCARFTSWRCPPWSRPPTTGTPTRISAPGSASTPTSCSRIPTCSTSASSPITGCGPRSCPGSSSWWSTRCTCCAASSAATSATSCAGSAASPPTTAPTPPSCSPRPPSAIPATWRPTSPDDRRRWSMRTPRRPATRPTCCGIPRCSTTATDNGPRRSAKPPTCSSTSSDATSTPLPSPAAAKAPSSCTGGPGNGSQRRSPKPSPPTGAATCRRNAARSRPISSPASSGGW